MAETSGYWTYSIASDEVTVTGYVGNESRVVIPETLEGKPVVAIGDNAFDNNSEVEVIIVPSTVTNIGDHAFWGATSLHTVAFKSSTPATLGESIFSSMGIVRNIYVPTDAVDAYKTSWLMGTGTNHIKSDPTDAEFIDYSGPAHFTYRVNDDYKTATVTGCADGSTTFEVRGSASRKDDNGEYDYYNVVAIADGAFQNSHVARVSLPNSIKKIGARAFDGPELQEVLVYSNSYHESLDPSECEIADDAFPNNADYHIYVPSDKVDDFQQAWTMFADKIAAYPTTVTVGDYEYSYKQYDLTSATVSLKKYIGSDSYITLPESPRNGEKFLIITGIEDGAFADNKSIKTVTIPYTFSGHSFVVNRLFNGCSNLSKVFIKSNYLYRNLGFGADCFSGCSSNLLIYVPNYLSDFKLAWKQYASLLKENIAGTSFTIGDYEYQADANVDVWLIKYTGSESNLIIPEQVVKGESTYPLKAIFPNAFQGNTSLDRVVVPATVNTVDHGAFSSSNLSFAKFLGANTTISNTAFDDCGNLKTVVVPEGTYDFYKQNAANSQFADKIVENGGVKTLTDQEGLGALARQTYYESGNLGYHRSLAADAQYATLCLPFDFDLSTAGFEQAYTPMNSIIHFVSASSTATGGEEAGQKEKLILMLKKYNDDKVAAGTPLFVKLGSDKNIDIVSASDVKLESTSSPNLDGSMTVVDWDGTSGLMEQNDNFSIYYNGTYQSQKASSISNLYTFNSDGTFGPQISGTLNPFRMYLTVNTYSMPMSAYSLSIGVNDGGTTGIRELVTTPAYKVSMSKAIYDLNGRMVSATGSTEGLPKGVYIQNHKKIIVE